MTAGDGRSAGERRFASVVLTITGAALVVLALAIDWLAGETQPQLGHNQVLGLVAGSVMLVLGIGLPRSGRLRALARRLWPFGDELPSRPRAVLALSLWLAGLAALLDLGLRLTQQSLGLRWSTPSPHIGWMTPLSYGVVLLAVGGVLAFFAGRGWRRLGAPRLAAFTLLLVAIMSALSVYEEELHWISIGLLSLGIAAQGSRLLARRRGGLERLVRASARPLACAVGLAAVLPFARVEWSEWRSLATTVAPPAGAPNVLLVVFDTVRAQSLSLYGYDRGTSPNLEALARRSVVYDRVFSPSSWTLPSHATMFTGYAPHLQSANFGQPLDDARPTLAEFLRDRGWYTLGVVANHDNAFPHSGLDRGFLRYDAGVASIDELLGSSGAGRLARWSLRRFGSYWPIPPRKDADQVSAEFLEHVGRRGERPFFAFLNFYDAHFPFDRPVPEPASMAGRDLADGRRLVADYDRELAFLDDRLARILETLERNGTLARTIVIVTSDHGEEFGEHGVTGHGWNLYATTIRVPLLISWPGTVPEDVRVGTPVSLQDLPATIAALVGLERETPFPGRSLLPSGGGAPAPRPVLSELSGNPELPFDEIPGWNDRSLVAGRFHYLRRPDRSEELYDLVADSSEARDLAGLTPGTATLPHLRAALSSLIGGEPADESGGDRELAAVGRGEPQGQR